MDQRIIDLYDTFTHGGMSRRAFLDRLAEIAGSSAAAVALLPLLQNDYARGPRSRGTTPASRSKRRLMMAAASRSPVIWRG
jgi:carboxymethylenebutenolidase